MTADQIIAALPDCPAEIAQAIRDLDARNSRSNGGPKLLNELTLHPRLLTAVKAAGGVTKAAEAWKCSRTHIYDVIDGKRPPGPLLQAAIGVRRKGAGMVMYEVLD